VIHRTTIDETGVRESAVAARHAMAYAHIAATDTPPKDYERFCEAAEKAFGAAQKTLVAAGCKGNMRAARMRRRQLVAAAMNANAVPRWIRVLHTATWFAPWPWSVVIAAILYAVEQMLEGE
jgi:hypothetical protein